ncbi:MAG: hypoxanthine phosphoribosyltransferase [Acidobacteriaceae bacterium]
MTNVTSPPLACFLTHNQIQQRVGEMGAEISRDYAGQRLVLVGVLKGAAIFLADLARAITVDCTFDFVAVSSYGKSDSSSGAVRLIKDLDHPIEGRNVVLVEDILDTGLTLGYLRNMLLQRKPAALKIAAFLDKPARRLLPMRADYVGFSMPNDFVIGYGMDFAERYRNLPDVCFMPQDPQE